MNIDEAFTGTYLKATDFPQPVLWTIRAVKMEPVGQGNEQENKPIVYFQEDQRGLVLNKTNANMIKYYYGSNTDMWTMKQMVIHVKPVDFGGKIVDGIRLAAEKGTPTFNSQANAAASAAAADHVTDNTPDFDDDLNF